jgi:hypothetical protein
MRNLKLFLFGLTISLLFNACKKDDYGSLPKGDLIGYTYLYDVNGIRNTDNSMINVRFQDSYGGFPSYSGKDGKWICSNIPSGNYTLVISMPNYGTMKYEDKSFIGGGQFFFGSTSLYQIPSYTLTGLTDSTTKGEIYIQSSFSGTLPQYNGGRCRYFISPNSNVSSDPTNYVFTVSVTHSMTSQVTPSTGVSSFQLKSYGIITGDTVYIVGYAENYTTSSYLDVNTGRNVYPNLNPTPSNVLKVIVP